MKSKRDLGALDIFRIIAAALVILIHAPALLYISDIGNIILSGAIARIAVPFFFAVTGIFTDFSSAENIKKLVLKTLLLYAAATAVYLPYGAYSSSVKAVLFDGTFYHLWYFPALITGALAVYALNKLPRPFQVIIASALYIFGLCGDSYSVLARNIPAINAALNFLSGIFSFTRNGLFFAPIFLMTGNIIGERISATRRRSHMGVYIFCLIISLAALILERLLLRDMIEGMIGNMFITLIPCTIFLLLTLTSIKIKPLPMLRTVSMWIYIVHPVILELGSRIFNISDTAEDIKSAICKAALALGIAAVSTVLFSRKKRSPYRTKINEKISGNV